MTKSKECNEKVVIPEMQIILRKALLHKAGPETKNKFTGEGFGNNAILTEDAECIVATLMEVIGAKRNNTEIEIDGARYKANEYLTYGDGLAKCQNWNGNSYYSDVDDEREERSFVKMEVPKYIQDEVVVDGKTFKAEGKVVSPTKLDQLITSFNGLNAKLGDNHKIKTGGNVDKAYIKFGDFNYLYVEGNMRRLADSNDGYGQEFATFMEPRVNFSGFIFGSISEEAAELKVLEWLL